MQAAFTAERPVHPVRTQVSPHNLGTNPPVLRPAAEVCSSLYTATPPTLLVMVSFPIAHTGRLSLRFFQQTALAPPCTFAACEHPATASTNCVSDLLCDPLLLLFSSSAMYFSRHLPTHTTAPNGILPSLEKGSSTP